MLDIAQEARQLSNDETTLRQDLKLRILGLAALERCRRRQASRINPIKAGDACTRFFHLKMLARKRKQFIPALKGADGGLLWKHEDKEHVIQNYFQNLIGNKLRRAATIRWPDIQLGSLQQIPGLELDRPFTEAEVEFVVKPLPNEKAPERGRFTNDFYKHCWQVIRQDVLNAFHSFYNHHCGALERLNRAQVVLIPKVEVATEPKDFRPISLIHSFAKLLTKVLAIRLAAYIDNLISTSQSAFIRKRCIPENFMYVRGLARYFHRTKTPACLIKLDITKAFDSVSWEYLLELLHRRNFPARWLDWLAAILRTSSSSVLLNGTPGEPIKH